MGMGLIYSFIFLLVFAIIAIGLLIYSIKRKSKYGLITSIGMLILVLLVLSTNTIDELSINKKDVRSDLGHINIELLDDFKITKNKVTGMPERIQETKVLISSKDKERLINEIKNSENYTTDSETSETEVEIHNIKYPEFYSRSIYGRIDNYPTRIYLSIYQNSDTIRYQRIEM